MHCTFKVKDVLYPSLGSLYTDLLLTLILSFHYFHVFCSENIVDKIL